MEKRTSGEVLAMVQSEGCDFVDLRFCDLPGIMQHVTIPAEVLSEGTFVDGHGFDGSSIRGFQEIQESDMILHPGSRDGVHRSVHAAQDAGDPLLRGRPGDRRELQP